MSSRAHPPRRLRSFAFDGQYQSRWEGHASGLKVQQHLVEKLQLDGDYAKSQWDGGHRIELGMDTVRNEVSPARFWPF